jgi:hypothetical protein
MFMNHILEKLNVLFIIEVFAISFSVVALYVLVANSIVYLLVRKRTNEMVRELMKRFLFKFPFKAMGYTFAAGLVGYIGITLTDALLGGNITASTPALDTRPRIVLILFALFGFCFGILVGLALFFKAYKVLSSNGAMK